MATRLSAFYLSAMQYDTLAQGACDRAMLRVRERLDAIAEVAG